MCPKCFHIERENRNFKKFKCKECSYECDADNNASENIKNRYYDIGLKEVVEKNKYNKDQRHSAIKEYYKEKQFTAAIACGSHMNL
jgi:hypothetical protein